MASSYRIAISAENHPYHGWQALLTSRAIVEKGERRPLVLVHTPDWTLLRPEFRLIERAGTGEVVSCRDRSTDGARYAPRNIPGALLATATAITDDLVALIDPDMLMLRRMDFASLGAGPGVVSLDSISYLPHQANDPWVGEGCRRYADLGGGVGDTTRPGLAALAMSAPYGGNCYVVHRADRERLASAWLGAIEAFRQDRPVPDGSRYYWTTAIWAGMLAIHRLGLGIRITDMMRENYILNPASVADGKTFLHFCLGDATFAKRDYQSPPEAAHRVWDVRPLGDGTLSDLIRGEVADAARFYGLDDPEQRRRLLVDGDLGAFEARRGTRGIAEPGKGAVTFGDVQGDPNVGPGNVQVEIVPPHPGLALGVVRGGAGVDDHGLYGQDEVAVGEAGRYPEAMVAPPVEVSRGPAAVGGRVGTDVEDYVEHAAVGDSDQLPLRGGILIVQPAQHAEGGAGDSMNDEVRLDAGLPQQGVAVGLDERAAGVDVERWFDQERVGQGRGQEAHVSLPWVSEPRLRWVRGRRRPR